MFSEAKLLRRFVNDKPIEDNFAIELVGADGKLQAVLLEAYVPKPLQNLLNQNAAQSIHYETLSRNSKASTCLIGDPIIVVTAVRTKTDELVTHTPAELRRLKRTSGLVACFSSLIAIALLFFGYAWLGALITLISREALATWLSVPSP